MPKKKKAPASCDPSTVPHIPHEILIDKILPRLPPAQLLALASASRFLTSSLSYDIVLASAVFARTNRAVQNLRLTINLVQAGKIWLPSPMRILRLLAGRGCELSVPAPQIHHSKVAQKKAAPGAAAAAPVTAVDSALTVEARAGSRVSTGMPVMPRKQLSLVVQHASSAAASPAAPATGACNGRLDFLRSWCGVHACWGW